MQPRAAHQDAHNSAPRIVSVQYCTVQYSTAAHLQCQLHCTYATIRCCKSINMHSAMESKATIVNCQLRNELANEFGQRRDDDLHLQLRQSPEHHYSIEIISGAFRLGASTCSISSSASCRSTSIRS